MPKSIKTILLISVNIFLIIFGLLEIFILIYINRMIKGPFTNVYEITSDPSALLPLSPVFLVIYLLIFIFLIAKEFIFKKMKTKILTSLAIDIILCLFIAVNIIWASGMMWGLL